MCFLHSYATPDNERAMRDAVAVALPGAYLCISSDVLPELREFERFSTTILNAYIGPLMQRYLDALQATLRWRRRRPRPRTGPRKRRIRRARRLPRVRPRRLRCDPLDPRRAVAGKRETAGRGASCAPASGGEGRRRGGLGMHRAVRLEEGEAVYPVLGNHACVPPFGIGGAGSALPVRVAKVSAGTRREFDTPGKVTVRVHRMPAVAGGMAG